MEFTPTEVILKRAKAAAACPALRDTEAKNRALAAMAQELRAEAPAILAENAADLEASRGKVSDVMLDRLALNEARLEGMAAGIEAVAALPDPVGRTLDEFVRPDGLRICKRSVPMGVIAIIYESRPNVTSDAAALALKSGNVCVLRSGREAYRSAAAITAALRRGLERTGLTPDLVNLVEDTSHAGAAALMTATGYVDLLIPRGGAGLIRACVEHATVPCIQTGTGICHVYVDESADLDMALDIMENAKTSRPSVCNAAEVLLVHRAAAPRFLPMLQKRLCGPGAKHPVRLRCDEEAAAILGIAPDPEFDTEFWTMCWPSASWTTWRAPSATSRSIPRTTARPSSRKVRKAPPASRREWTARPSMSTPRRASRTAANSASAARWASRRRSSTRAGRSA